MSDLVARMFRVKQNSAMDSMGQSKDCSELIFLETRKTENKATQTKGRW